MRENIFRMGCMDKLPSLDKKKIEVASLNDIEEEKRYWNNGMGQRVKGRRRRRRVSLRAGATHDKALFEVKKDDIGPENAYFWEV